MSDTVVESTCPVVNGIALRLRAIAEVYASDDM